MINVAEIRAKQGYRDWFPRGELPAQETPQITRNGLSAKDEAERGHRNRTWVVFNGIKMGIFRTWLEAGYQVTGFSGALHRRYPSLKAAQFAWDCACRAGQVGSPEEWGAARAKEVVPSQSSLAAIQEEATFSWTRRVHSGSYRHPLQTVPLATFSLPREDSNLPTLYAIRLAPAPVPSNKTWYVVLMGAYPGVYLGRRAAIRAMGLRGRCLWESMGNEGDAVLEYITQVQAGKVIQYTTRAP